MEGFVVMNVKNIIIRSIMFGIVLFVGMLVLKRIFQSNFEWYQLLVWVVIITLFFFGYLWKDKKSKG